jgi:purine nucleosidase
VRSSANPFRRNDRALRARGWLAFWREDIGRNGFYPFDVLAAAYALRPDLFDCASITAQVARDENLWGWLYGPEGLLVAPEGARSARVRASGSVLYCPRVDPRFGEWMMSRL